MKKILLLIIVVALVGMSNFCFAQDEDGVDTVYKFNIGASVGLNASPSGIGINNIKYLWSGSVESNYQFTDVTSLGLKITFGTPFSPVNKDSLYKSEANYKTFYDQTIGAFVQLGIIKRSDYNILAGGFTVGFGGIVREKGMTLFVYPALDGTVEGGVHIDKQYGFFLVVGGTYVLSQMVGEPSDGANLFAGIKIVGFL